MLHAQRQPTTIHIHSMFPTQTQTQISFNEIEHGPQTEEIDEQKTN